MVPLAKTAAVADIPSLKTSDSAAAAFAVPAAAAAAFAVPVAAAAAFDVPAADVVAVHEAAAVVAVPVAAIVSFQTARTFQHFHSQRVLVLRFLAS